jgi:hypothetical protein
LNDLKNIKTKKRKEKILALKNGILKNKILFSLPINDITKFNREISKAVLEMLFIMIDDLFTNSSTKDEKKQFELLFKEANGYNILLFFLNIYKNDEQKELIAIILGNFYSYINIPEEGKIIINILINSLKKNIKNNFTDVSIKERIRRVLGGLIHISLNEENKLSVKIHNTSNTSFEISLFNSVISLIGR